MSYRNNAISSDDPQAIEKLTQKLEKCKERQSFMKMVNAYYRKNGTAKGCDGVSDQLASKMDQSVKEGYSWEKAPFPSYKLSGNNQEIHRLEKRIEQLSQNKTVGFVGWQFEGGEAVANTENNRLQLFFDERPSEEQRDTLKRSGFRWAPGQGAWQRQLNQNAIRSANYVSFIQPCNGMKPTEIQPKAPIKEETLER